MIITEKHKRIYIEIFLARYNFEFLYYNVFWESIGYVIWYDYEMLGKKVENSCWALLINFFFSSTVSTVNYWYSMRDYLFHLLYMNYSFQDKWISQNYFNGNYHINHYKNLRKHQSWSLINSSIIHFAFSITAYNTFICYNHSLVHCHSWCQCRKKLTILFHYPVLIK